MALIQISYMSGVLKRTVPVQVILPVDKMTDAGYMPVAPMKTLYLLNGFLGNHTDWVANTRIQRWAEEKNLAVVMPAGENSFYIDQDRPNSAYGRFIGEELVIMTRRMFPLSCKREDTFIAGLSMGGFGAFRNGLKYHQTFSHVAGLSSALHIFEDIQDADGCSIFEEHVCFGDLREAAESDKNPRYLVKKLKEEKGMHPEIQIPAIYMACGTEDGLIGANRSFAAFLEEEGIAFTYEEEAGNHDWDFWDTFIQKILSWLPLDAASQGIHSGNVKK